jgi:type IV pilus assembly protein PilY1
MSKLIAMLLPVVLVLMSQAALASPDYYYGDSAIYVGGRDVPDDAKPNILLFIDSSKQMKESGTSGVYQHKLDAGGNIIPWPGSNSSSTIYYKSNSVYKSISANMTNVKNGYPYAYGKLDTNGNFIGCIDSKGKQCTNKTQDYYSGDYLNWKEAVGTPSAWNANKQYMVNDLVYKPGYPNGRVYRCTVAGTSGGTDPFPIEDGSSLLGSYPDGSVTWQPQMPLIEVLEKVLNNGVFPELAAKANFGLMKYNSNDQGGAIVVPVASNSASTLKTAMTNSIVPIYPDRQRPTFGRRPVGCLALLGRRSHGQVAC